MNRKLSLRALCLITLALLCFFGLRGAQRSAAQTAASRLIHVAEAVPQQYIVVFNTTSNQPFAPAPQIAERTQRVASAYHARVGHIYTHTFNGFSARMTPDDALRLSRDPDVKYVEEDGIVRISGEQKDPPSWGLSRICTRQLDLPNPYTYPDSAGQGIAVYVLDTGIQTTQPDFGGRAVMVQNYITGEANTDLNGHGTFVAGTIGSRTFGVAKKVNLYGVKVLNSGGFGSFSDVIAGIDYVIQNAAPGKTVINMSLGGSLYQPVDDAVSAASAAGIVVIVAAGNSDIDACTVSPAGASGAFAVGATDQTDTIAYFSNWGPCVSLLAPGVNITSLSIRGAGATAVMSGTSMASPHVAGIAALFMAMKQYPSTQAVYADLTNFSTAGVIKGLNISTTNHLAYNSPNSIQ